jgi:uncharacterized UBP type Zn finger protein
MESVGSECKHTDQIKDVTPSGDECSECKTEGTKAVALRLCLTCGHVGCCDSSVGQHARKHYTETKHPIIESYRSTSSGGKEWRYCYIESVYV